MIAVDRGRARCAADRQQDGEPGDHGHDDGVGDRCTAGLGLVLGLLLGFGKCALV